MQRYLIISLLPGVSSISFLSSLLCSAHFLGECHLRLGSLRSHAKRPEVNARNQCAYGGRFAGWLSCFFFAFCLLASVLDGLRVEFAVPRCRAGVLLDVEQPCLVFLF